MEISILVFTASFLFLLWSSKILPQSIGGIARILHLSEFITAFFLVAFATSIPELFIGISSAVQGAEGLSLGNIMGANLINLTLVIGVSAIFTGALKGDGHISSQNFWIVFLLTMLPMILATDGEISRADGLVLLIAFSCYIAKIFHDQQYFHKILDGTKVHVQKRSDIVEAVFSIPELFRHISHFALGIILLLGTSIAVIWSAKDLIHNYFGDHLIFFGVLFLALGTTLPELAFGIRASLRGETHLMLGNSIGTIAFNSAAIIGIVALLNPIELNFREDLLLVSLFLTLAFIFFHIFIYTRHRLSRIEGCVMVLVYLAFFATMFSRCVECVIR